MIELPQLGIVIELWVVGIVGSLCGTSFIVGCICTHWSHRYATIIRHRLQQYHLRLVPTNTKTTDYTTKGSAGGESRRA